MKKQTLASRVLAFLKGGDEAKLSRFETKLEKYFSKQISMREEAITELNEKISDAKDKLAEIVVNVDLNRINASEQAGDYVVDYLENVRNQEDVVNDLQDQITEIQKEIDSLKTTQETVYSVNEAA